VLESHSGSFINYFFVIALVICKVNATDKEVPFHVKLCDRLDIIVTIHLSYNG
jgi:hypothetical protein